MVTCSRSFPWHALRLLQCTSLVVGALLSGSYALAVIAGEAGRRADLDTFAPEFSLLDPTLPRSQRYQDFRCGLAEMLKVAIASCADTFDEMERMAERGSTEADIVDRFTRPTIIELSVAGLLRELSADLYEAGSLRRSADFGHSFSPEIEARFNGMLSHGDAVAFEMLVLTEVARSIGLIDDDYRERIYVLYESLRLPMIIPGVGADLIWKGLQRTVLHRAGPPSLAPR